jgi:plasmid stabilization system protein ParE
VPKLVFRSAALRDLAEIASYVERESGRETAISFTDKIVSHCERIAGLPGRIGRPRPEFGKDYRGKPFGNYVIFFRYANEDGPRSHLYVVAIVHAARDIEANFSDRIVDE